MSKRPAKLGDDALDGQFGFDPNESAAHFLVHIPTSSQHPVEISEHLSWDETKVSVSQHYGVDRADGQVRVRLARQKWNDIADVMRAEFNARLKSQGRRPGKWKVGFNPVIRPLGKELVLLAWAIEDADPSLTRTAIANWQGLSPEERWWMYTMTAAATGHATTSRGLGWRKAVRYALTENPVTNRVIDQPVVPEFFRLASGEASIFNTPSSAQSEEAVSDQTAEPIPETLLPDPIIQKAAQAAVEPVAKRRRSKKKTA